MNEIEIANIESKRNTAEDAYFKARPQIDTADRRRVFQAGFDRAYSVVPIRAIYAIRAKCEKCHGEGWLWGNELDDADEATREDTMTSYRCDGDMCKLADEIAHD